MRMSRKPCPCYASVCQCVPTEPLYMLRSSLIAAFPPGFTFCCLIGCIGAYSSQNAMPAPVYVVSIVSVPVYLAVPALAC